MFPAAVGIVVASFPLRERGRAMAIFFGISGGLTAIGPIAGGYLTAVDVAVDLLDQRPGGDHRADPDLEVAAATIVRRPTKLDYRGTVLITGAMGLIVLGLQQSGVWGWSSVATWACIVVGLALMVGVRRLGAAHARSASAPADLPRPRLCRGERRARA